MNFLSPKKKKPEQACRLKKLITATCNGWTNSVIELVKNGVNVNDKIESGITPLHIAAVSGDNEMVKILIKSGADVNCRENMYLSTPLHFAAIKGNVVSIQNLIELNQEIANRGCSIISDVSLSDSRNYEESYEAVILTLVRKGADLNAKDVHGKTPLHLAVHYNSGAVKTLLGLGAEVDPQDNAGRLPWHYALDHNSCESLEWLLAFGADINDFNMFDNIDLEKIRYSLMNYLEIRSLIFGQLIRLRAAKLFISKIYAAYTYRIGIEMSHNYYNKCVNEVRKMEFYEIEDGVSLFDFLHMSPRQKIAYTKASDKTESMLIKCESEFPNYYGIIRASFYDDQKRKPLINPAKSAWYHLTNINLPDICVENILSYLNSSCLKIMIEGAKNCEALK